MYFIKYRSNFFFFNTKLVWIFRFYFFNTKVIYIFINTDLIFFNSQNWSVFLLNTDLIFVTQLHILKFKRRDWKLGWSLFFFLICDACIMNLSHECESSFKSFIFYFLFYVQQQIYFFFNKPKIIFYFLFLFIFYFTQK